MIESFVSSFIYFFAVIDPIGSVPVFIAVTRALDPKLLPKIALQATAVSFLVLMFFILVGQILLEAMNVPLPAFQIAGGIVLFLFALSMIFGESKPDEEVKLATQARETAIFPLAIPSIAGPGAILASILLTDNSTYSIPEQALTASAVTAVLLLTLLFLLLAGPIHRLIGQAGASIVSRIMGLILSAVGVTNILDGVRVSFGI